MEILSQISYRRLIDISYSITLRVNFLFSPFDGSSSYVLQHHLIFKPGQGLCFPASSQIMLECFDTCRLISNFYIFHGDCLCLMDTKKQVTVSRSSADAEYRSMACTRCEYLAPDSFEGFICNNFFSLSTTLLWQPCISWKTKHIHMGYHLVGVFEQSGQVKTMHVSSSSSRQLAEMFSKALDHD